MINRTGSSMVPKSVAARLGLILFAAGVVVGVIALSAARSNDSHYEPGFARIDGYSLDPDGRTLVFSTPVGSGDVLLGYDLAEKADAVTVTVRASIYVPGRNTFKNLSATLDTTRVVLAQPLGTRPVIDGATGRTVKRFG